MRSLMLKLWKDDGGALLGAEWVFIATILVLGTIVGLVTVRNAVNSELIELAGAITGLNQNYSFAGEAVTCPGNGNATKAFVGGGSATGDVPEQFALTPVANPTPNNIEQSACP